MHVQKISKLLLVRTVVFSVTIGVAASTVLIAVNLAELRSDQRDQTERLVDLASGPASAFAFDMDSSGAERFLGGLVQNRTVLSARLLNEFGEQIAQAGQTTDASSDEIEVALEHPTRAGVAIGTLYVSIDWSTDNALFIRRSIEEIVASVLVALLLGGALYFTFRSALTRPLSRIVSALGVEAGSIDEPTLTAADLVPVKSVEMLGLVDSLNQLRRDVAARERSLLDLRERTMSELFESAPDAMLIADRYGRIIRHNERLSALFGFTSDEIEGMSVEDLMPDRSRTGHGAMMASYFANPLAREMGSGLELAGLRRNGEEFPLEIGLSPFHDTDDVMAVASIRDITARKRAEASNRRLSKVFMNASDPIVIENLGGIVTDLNHAAVEAYGWDRDELVGRPIKRLVPEVRHQQADELLHRCLAGEDVRDVEGLRVARDGTILNVLITLSLLRDEHDQPFAVASIVKDITEMKALEAELIDASRRAEAANHAKSQFLSHMSHELRTPLNGVLGYAQILQRDPGATDDQRHSLDAIVNCGVHLLSLINDVLDLSKIEAGRVELHPEACDLSSLIHNVRDVISQRAAAKGIAFTTEVSNEVPRMVVTDQAKVRQVLINLLGNAIKFTETGSVSLEIHQDGPALLQMNVVDTGVGMDSHELEMIFDPFKQVEAGKTAGGTGLGLAISRKLAEALGGELTVMSEKGVGSTFTMTLPLVEADAEDLADFQAHGTLKDADVRLAPGESRTVLVADDRETNRDILRSMLEGVGIAPVVVDDGDVALNALRERDDIDLVLMDVRMPRLNGIEVVRQIREDEALRHHCVIAVTASVFPEFRERAIEAGFDDFLGKPFRTEELIEKLRKHLDVEFVSIGRSNAVPEADHALTGETATRTADAIREAIRLGNVTALEGIASTLEDEPGAGSLADRVGALVRAFDFTGLTALADELSSSTGDVS